MTLLRHCERSPLCHPERSAVRHEVEGSRPAFIWAARRSAYAPRRHALFCGASLRLAARAPLTKPSRAPLTAFAAPVSSPRGHDRCRGCALRNNPVEAC